MTDALKLAEQQLLAPGGLGHKDLEKVLHHLMGPSVDAGDLYFQNTCHEAWSLEDGLVRSATHAVEQGVGIRAISGEKIRFEPTHPPEMRADGEKAWRDWSFTGPERGRSGLRRV